MRRPTVPRAASAASANTTSKMSITRRIGRICRDTPERALCRAVFAEEARAWLVSTNGGDEDSPRCPPTHERAMTVARCGYTEDWADVLHERASAAAGDVRRTEKRAFMKL